MDVRIQCVVVDAHDCEVLARFWSSVLGWRITYEADDQWAIEPPEGSPEVDVAPDILFVKVPDEKIAKSRLHFDLRPKDQNAEVHRILELGATGVDIGQGDVSWVGARGSRRKRVLHPGAAYGLRVRTHADN